MEKEKLLLIREFLINTETEAETLTLPENIVLDLLKEDKETLKLLVNDPSHYKQESIDFILNANTLTSREKRQVLIHLIEMERDLFIISPDITDTNFSQYKGLLIDFCKLDPQSDDVFEFIEKAKKVDEPRCLRRVIDGMRNLSIVNTDILALLKKILERDFVYTPTLERIENVENNLNFFHLIKSKGISSQDCSEYLSWILDSEAVAELLKNEHLQNLTLQEIRSVLAQVRKTKPASYTRQEIEIFTANYFPILLAKHNLELSEVLAFIDEREKKEDLMCLKILNKGMTLFAINENDPLEFSKQVSETLYKIDPQNEYGFDKLLFSSTQEILDISIGPMKKGDTSLQELADLLTYLKQLEPLKRKRYMEILATSPLLVNSHSFLEVANYLKQISSVHPSLEGELCHSIVNNSRIALELYPYLIEKISNSPSVSVIEKKQFQTALWLIDYALELTIMRKLSIDDMRELIDLTLNTKEAWQLENIQEVAQLHYPNDIKKDTYLMAIKYMAEMKKRPKEDWATRPRKKSYLYQNQIAEVDNLLKQLEQDNPKILQKK